VGRNTEFNYGFNANEPAIYDCLGRVICVVCGKFHGYCNELTSATDRAGGHGAPGDGMDLGSHYDKDAKKGGGKFKQRPFLKSTDVAAKGSTAKITDVREAPKQMQYSDILCDLTIGKKEYTWGLKSKSITLNMLIDELGKRTEKWIGKTIKLVRGGNKGQYVNLG
jgi:hypothetical protein